MVIHLLLDAITYLTMMIIEAILAEVVATEIPLEGPIGTVIPFFIIVVYGIGQWAAVA